MADVHLGAHREPHLRRLELEAFDAAMTKCVELGVDFILVCGDLFHVGIPDLGVVDSALKVMMKVRESGIPIYAIYGSHDYTPNGTSIIDILGTAGVIANVFKPRLESGMLELEVTVDEKTRAKLFGISARKVGLESNYYEILDRAKIEDERGFKVFAFHSGITQFKPLSLSQMETVDISRFPRGLDYYAGGHIHQRGEFSMEGYGKIVFPGPLFTGYGKDLEDTVRGESRGFYLVEFDDKLRNSTFVPIKTFNGLYEEYDFGGINSVEANRRLAQELEGLDVSGKVVVLRAFGQLSGGRVGDIEFGKRRSELMARGAVYVHLNRSALSSMETAEQVGVGEDPALIEERVLRERTVVNVSAPELKGEGGALLGKELLRLLRHPPKTGEAKKDYESRMLEEAIRTMKLEGVV
jgi:DNA repair exonuclease SbcCD nuclease subunit